MGSTNVTSSIEAINNVAKIAANLTTPKAEEKNTYKGGDSTNQPHNQTVEVKVGSEQKPQPVVVHEKKETHIHKPFPDSRSLTAEECAVETLRINNEHEEKMAELEYRKWLEEECRKERREREEEYRKERERKREKEDKFFKRMLIGGCIAGTIGLGCYGYYIYTNTRNSTGRRLVFQPQKTPMTISAEPINTEGTVK